MASQQGVEKAAGDKTREESTSALVALPKISVIIPTFRRPKSLRRALESCQAQVGISPDDFEVVVVDNCPDRTASDTVKEVSAHGRLRFRYESEPIPGVSAARNRGVASAHGQLIAFLDDDEDAEPEWLAALVAAQRESGSDAVFGAVLGHFDGPTRDNAQLHEKEMTRLFTEPSGPVPARRIASLGSGNSLFRRSCFSGAEPFDLSLGLAGGEDSALIRKLLAEGRQLNWCPEARVREYFSEERLTMRYLLKRRFSAGQVRTSLCVSSEHSNKIEALLWMLVGAAQVSVGGMVAIATSPFSAETARRYLCIASGGLGKILWMAPFRVRRYPERHKTEQP